MIIHSERAWGGPTICLTTRSRRYLQHECSGFLAYIVDTSVQGKKYIEEIPVVRDFSYVFPEDFQGVLPKMRVEFRIDLVLCAAPITKASYRLVSPEIQELSTQLQDQLNKDFISSINSP